MKFNTYKMSRLNESVVKSLGVKKDEKIDPVKTLNTTEVNAIESELEAEKNKEENFKEQNKVVDEFIKDNHKRDHKPVKNDDLKKMRLSESLFEDCDFDEEEEVIEEALTYDEPTLMGKGYTAPLVDDYTSDIKQLVKLIDEGDKEFAKPSLKRIVKRLFDNKASVENFNDYWAERYPASIDAIDNQIELIGPMLLKELLSDSVEESIVEATAVEEPEKTKRFRSPNEKKEKGNYSSEDLWLAVYDELSAEVDNEGEGKEVNKQLKARRGERYEKVLPIGDSDIVVYATSPEEFEFAKKVAQFYEVSYDEPKLDTNKSTNDYYKYSMRIHIPMEDLYDWSNN